MHKTTKMMKEIKDLNNGRTFNVHELEDVVKVSALPSLVQCNPNQDCRKLFYRYRQIDSTVCLERHNTCNSQHNTEQ